MIVASELIRRWGWVGEGVVGRLVVALYLDATALINVTRGRPCEGPGLSPRRHTRSLLKQLALGRGMALVRGRSFPVRHLNVTRCS